VVSVTLNPPSPVGIGSVTFTIVFSENMDTSVSPTVTLGKTSPYNEHTVSQTSYSADTWVGTFTIEAGYDGEQHLSISGAKNPAGNAVMPDTSHTFLVDTTSPTGTFSINSGATYTNSQWVTLILSADNAAEMHFSNDNPSWSSWEPYATSKSWTLISGDGTKTVYVQFKDSVGNVSETYSDTIILDRTSPTGSISINGGAAYTNSQSVSLELSASDNLSGVPRMMIANSSSFAGTSWEGYATTKSWTLTSGDGTKTVYVQFKDSAGNVSETYSDTIILDGTPPTGSISINSGAAYTNSRSVSLELSASDNLSGVPRMMIANSSSFAGTSWEGYATTKFWTLTSADGKKKVYVKFKDGTGNVSGIYSDEIILDTNPPTTTLIDYPPETVTGNIPKVPITFTWIGSDAGGLTPAEELVYQYKLEGHSSYQEWSGWTKDTSETYPLPSGSYTFKVRGKDLAGNYPSEDDPAIAVSSFTVSLPLIIFPNPCYLNQGEIVTIASLPLESEVRVYIYDLGGNLVRTLGETETVIEGGSKVATWDLKNNKGEIVARGIYIYFIPSTTEKRTGKIAIIK